LVFDPNNIKKHGLTYTILSYIQTKEKLFLLIPLQHEVFYVDLRVHVKMNRLKTIVTWIPSILQYENVHKFHVIIQALNKFLYANIMKTSIMIITFKCLISYVLKKQEYTMHQSFLCVQIYKFIKVFINFNPRWSWVNDEV